jgi:hypothetical protein
MKMASFGEGDHEFWFCFRVRIDWMSEFKQMGGVLIGLIFEADSGDEFFGSVERFFYLQAGILLFRRVVFGDSEVLSVVVEIFELVNFFDVLVLKKYSVEDEIVVELRFFGVFGSVFFESVEFAEVVIGHLKVLLWSGEMVAFGFDN